jgi:peptidoglycan/xylan/chitin deacetylase (PgdA/CDA1 family)
VLIFAGILKTRRAERGVARVRATREGGPVETRLGPEEAAIGLGRGRRRSIRSARFGASRVPPQAALTFDDGPDSLWTLRVLDALHRVDARATFFVITPLALEHRHIVSATLEAGHGIELHCTEHVRHTHCSRREVEADTREGLRILRSLGVEPRLWRQPWGILAPWTQEVAEDFGLQLAPWSADTHDWRGDTASEILHRVKPLLGPSSVVLLHDGLGPGSLRSGCEETVAFVEPLVARLRSMGCEPAPLTPPSDTSETIERREVGT